MGECVKPIKYEDFRELDAHALPENWEVLRVKSAISLIESGTSVNAYDYPADEGSLGVLKTSCVYSGDFNPAENKTVVAEDSSRVSCPLRAGTVIVSRMNTPDLVGAAGLVRQTSKNIFLPDRLWQVEVKDSDPTFFYYWTQSLWYRAQVRAVCQGTSSSMQNLSQADFQNFLFAKPPREEQAAVARFLDGELPKIDSLIAEQERLIELLTEKRQAVISHAVTKGLNPNAPLKDSEIEWLGQIPKDWPVKPLAQLTHPDRKIMYGIILPGPDVEEGVPIVKGGDIHAGRLTVDDLCKTTREIEANFGRSRLRAGDIVYSIRGSIGEAELVPLELEGANVTQDAARISPGDHVSRRWLLQVLKSAPVFNQLDFKATGATIRGINIFDLRRARLPVPLIREQEEIAEFIEQEVQQFKDTIADSKKLVDLLRERRAALISAAVTGKIDVRNYQPTDQRREAYA
jgi:type I restriction enzyme S subunit